MSLGRKRSCWSLMAVQLRYHHSFMGTVSNFWVLFRERFWLAEPQLGVCGWVWPLCLSPRSSRAALMHETSLAGHKGWWICLCLKRA